jgi:triosephosphate isomerase (TIM)
MRPRIVAANWKMHKTHEEFLAFNREFRENYARMTDTLTQTVIFPPSLYLAEQSKALSEFPHAAGGAQNCHYEPGGAFTGEISVPMIKSCGGKYVIAGHSERRQFFGDTDDLIARKILAIQQGGLIPVLCCGETKEERNRGQHETVVEKQLTHGLSKFLPGAGPLVVAYEPVWAIGTGQTATAGQAQQMHMHIRAILAGMFGADYAENIPILYGGSVKPANCAELFACKDIDGGLVGGASLNPADFISLIREMDRQLLAMKS